MTSRCATCGERLDPDDRVCPTCGTETARRTAVPARVRRCPRCGYRGEGIPYFRRPSHVVLLVVLGLLAYGIGGLLYWLVRRKHRVCPNCGLGWEHAMRSVDAERITGREGRPLANDGALPSSGGFRRVAGVASILVAVLLLSLGLIDLEPWLLAIGGSLGIGGGATFWWGWRALEKRREAIMAGFQREVLLLAGQKEGTLTVTEVAAELDLSLEAAEKVLISMDDGFRVRSEITKEGLLLYEFPEIQHRARLRKGEEP
ncbi:MAG: zinc ribbon domain-containing protein [Longimicrobiales bacterium]|nr:zinc ribbon domain-containing protein [Longimicrobiales bacterium]